MSDAQLSDHEWRLKMAREGKAIYVPGKTEEEVKARLDGETRKSLRLHLNVSLRELEGAKIAANNAATNYGAAAHAFELLAYCIGQGAIASDDEALGSTLFLLGQAMRRLDETEGSNLAQLGLMLGRAEANDFDFIPRNDKETAK
ncbi:hypothetical protein [Maliponia aquimaris]|uniref:Uncharacterized protein n=1 Tax=Maliponia aquimaris TaxID=1673631 RepID=A0A238L7V7_9RHOB|nr:hypothetical protein [Maliponia aquimaris]SMX50920.1 hypothetical protein MAA8898_05127 [Maliponia aquimaris]